MKAVLYASAAMWLAAAGGGQAPGRVRRDMENLRSGNAVVRREAAADLGLLGDREAAPALIRALSDPDARVRAEAAKALGFIKDGRAASALAKLLRDPDANVRFYAAYALGEIRDPKTKTALLAALRDPAWRVRDQAAWALRGLRDPSLAAPLAAELKKKDADADYILWLLRQLGGEQAVAALAGLLQSKDESVRLRAVEGLAEFKSKAAVPALIAALRDASPEVRLRAVEGLLDLRDERAKAPLKALAASERDPRVRAAAQAAARALSMRPDLVAYWSFDDRDPRVAKDDTGRGSNGRIFAAKPVKGKSGYALQFDKGAYIELDHPKSCRIGNTPLTIMAWVKTSAKNGVVIAKGGAFCGFSLYVKDGLPKFGIHRFRDGPAYIAAGKKPIGSGWTHLAGEVKAKRVEIYVNGVLAGSAKTTGYIPGECGQGMEIGFDVGNSAAEITDHFQGVIDEVKVFHANLSPKEIQKEMAASR